MAERGVWDELIDLEVDVEPSYDFQTLERERDELLLKVRKLEQAVNQDKTRLLVAALNSLRQEMSHMQQAIYNQQQQLDTVLSHTSKSESREHSLLAQFAKNMYDAAMSTNQSHSEGAGATCVSPPSRNMSVPSIIPPTLARLSQTSIPPSTALMFWANRHRLQLPVLDTLLSSAQEMCLETSRMMGDTCRICFSSNGTPCSECKMLICDKHTSSRKRKGTSVCDGCHYKNTSPCHLCMDNTILGVMQKLAFNGSESVFVHPWCREHGMVIVAKELKRVAKTSSVCCGICYETSHGLSHISCSKCDNRVHMRCALFVRLTINNESPVLCLDCVESIYQSSS